MSRSTVIGFAVLVLAGLAALWFLVIRDPDTTPAGAPAPAPTTAAKSTGTGPSLPAQPPTLTTATKPIQMDTTGMVVTDHRTQGSGSAARVLEAEPGSGSGGRKLPATLVRSVHANAMDIVLGCGRKVARADRGEKPRIGAKLQVGIKDGSMHVLSVTPELSDLNGDQLEAVKTCVHDGVMGLEVPVPDEADLDSYDLQLTYVVR